MTELAQRQQVGPKPDTHQAMLRGAQVERASVVKTYGGPTGKDILTTNQVVRLFGAELALETALKGDNSERAETLRTAMRIDTSDGRDAAISVVRQLRNNLDPYLENPDARSDETVRQAAAFDATLEFLSRPLPEQPQRTRGKRSR